jgi:hypothetical protein
VGFHCSLEAGALIAEQHATTLVEVRLFQVGLRFTLLRGRAWLPGVVPSPLSRSAIGFAVLHDRGPWIGFNFASVRRRVDGSFAAPHRAQYQLPESKEQCRAEYLRRAFMQGSVRGAVGIVFRD